MSTTRWLPSTGAVGHAAAQARRVVAPFVVVPLLLVVLVVETVGVLAGAIVLAIELAAVVLLIARQRRPS